MSVQLIVREYNGKEINQRQDGYFNATEMCRAGGKFFKDFERLESTKNYLKALEQNRMILPTDAVQVFQGVSGGSWVHKLVALELARWISPSFSIQCNLWIEELMSKGTVSINNQETKIIEEVKQTNQSDVNEDDLKTILEANQELFENNQEMRKEIIQLRSTIVMLQKQELNRLKPLTDKYLSIARTLLNLAYQVPSEGFMDAIKD